MTDAERNKVKLITEQLEQGLKELSEIHNGMTEWSSAEELEGLRNSLDTIRKSSSELIAKIEGQIPIAEEEQDFSAMKRAELYITELESEKTIFTDDERNLIVNYAYKMDSFEDARDLADRLSFLLENSPNLVAQTVINAREEIEQLPDPGIGLTEMHEYGYSWDEMLPLTKERAAELFHKEAEVYQLHVDGAETLIEDMEDIEAHGGIFGIDKSQWGLYQEREAHAQNYFEERNMEPVDQLLLGEQDQYGIFQLKHNDENRDIRFMSHDFLQKSGKGIDRENYELVYTAPLTEGVTLEGLYEKFNMHRPEDFTGHSLSVSDVVVLHQKGENTSHYVDSFGFTEVPEFHRYPTIEEQIAKEETIDLLQDQEEQVTAIQSGNVSQQEDDRSDSISYYVIEDLATWANHSKERSPLERFDNIDDAMKQFQSYREQEWEYSDDSARTTLGMSINGIEFDMIHVRNNENYLVRDFTHINGIENHIGFIDDLQILDGVIGFDKTRVQREMTPEEVKGFVKERFAHQLRNGGLEDISFYMERFDTLYNQGKMENLMPTVSQRRIQEDIPFVEWDNTYIGFNLEEQEEQPEQMAVSIEDRYISIQRVEDGYDYTIYNADYKELDGGVYDNPDISIQEALNEVVTDLREATENSYLQGKVKADSEVIPTDYEELLDKAETIAQKEIEERTAEEAAKKAVVFNFREKTNELFHNIHNQTPEDIEQTVYAYVQTKIDEYEAQTKIVDVVVAGSRCRGLEQEGSDLDVIVEFAGNEREDDLFNLVHEDGFMIGGVKVDINPITEEKTGTLATYLPEVEQYLAEKQMKQRAEQEQTEEASKPDTKMEMSDEASEKVTVTLTVAECSEFHNLGEYHEGIESAQNAISIWEQIPPERMRGIPSIGINVHTEGKPDNDDTQWDILIGKIIDLNDLSYVPDITDDLRAIRFISELIEKIPDVKVYGTLEPWLQKHAEKIASEADQLSYDYDPYEYRDQVEDREEHLKNITTDIRNGQAEYMEDFLNALIAEETRNGVQDLFGKGMDTDSSEAIQTARKAKDLLDKLTEYKPLAKVEELEEQNYNMIDNVLNNKKPENEQTEKRERVSLKVKLAEKGHQIRNIECESERYKGQKLERY